MSKPFLILNRPSEPNLNHGISAVTVIITDIHFQDKDLKETQSANVMPVSELVFKLDHPQEVKQEGRKAVLLPLTPPPPICI